jgi:hypothetical protein
MLSTAQLFGNGFSPVSRNEIRHRTAPAFNRRLIAKRLT